MEDRAPQLYAVTITVLVLVWISTSLRCYVRALIVKSFGVDDWLMILSSLFFSMYCAFVLAGLHYGTGKHAWDLQEDDMLKGIRYWYFCEWAYALSTTAMKVAIGTFFLRIAIETRHVQLIWILMIVNVLFGFSYFMCAVLQCVPIPYIWLKYATNPPRRSSATCISDGFQVWGSIAHSALCAASDWTLALLPIAMLWGTTMNHRTRATVYFLMGLGALASTATLVRISYLHTVNTKTDFLWVTFDVAVWSTVEGVGIVANGLATLRPLFRALLSSTATLGSNSNAYNVDSIPLSTLSANGKKESRIHMNLRHSTRLSSDNQSSDGIIATHGFGVQNSKSCSNSRVNVKEMEVGSTDVMSDSGRSGVYSPDFLNETSRWRPDNHKLGQFTTTVVGGCSNPRLYDDNESDNELKARRSTSRNRERNRDPRGRSPAPNMAVGITKITEFSIEDRKARESDFIGSPIGEYGLQDKSN